MNSPRWTRACLVLLWWGTVAASLHDGGAAGQTLLMRTAGLPPQPALGIVWLGCAWDAAIGLWLLWRPGPLAYRSAAAGVVVMTLLATALVPSLWLDPFGSLLKNLPLLALLTALGRKGRAP